MTVPDGFKLHKYSSANTAKIMLSNLTARYSAPTAFNDPFDTQLNLDLRFSDDELRIATIERMLPLVNGSRPIPGATTSLFLMSLEMIRQSRREINMSDLELVREMDPAIREGIENMRKALPALWNDLRTNFQNNVRIFCVSEVHDDLLMWSHYADWHRGVVIEFTCRLELDSLLSAAIPVQYEQEMPLLTTAEEWVNQTFGFSKPDLQRIWNNLHTVKSEHWSYEKEWRVIVPVEASAPEFLYWGIRSEEISSIYLGCRISDADRDEIVALAREKFPHVHIYQSIKNTRKFRLDFDLVQGLTV